MSAVLHLYERGFSLRKDARLLGGNKSGGGKRGVLDGSFSSASFRRLREFVIRFSVPSVDCWGITLTVPGLELLPIQDFKSMHHRLVVWCNDNGVPMVWRVELQQRKMPHLHCVCYCSLRLVMRLFKQWFGILRRYDCLEISDGDFVRLPRAFLKGSSHAVDLQKLSGGFDAFRYLVNHMSKAKQAQLGFAGRNWGVCNKDVFKVDEGTILDISELQYFYIVRWLRRLTRRRIFSKGCSFWVTDPTIVKRMQLYLEKNVDDFEFSFPVVSSCRVKWIWSYSSLCFWSSLPEGFEEKFYVSFRKDVVALLNELLVLALKWLVYYCRFARKGETLKVPDRASLSPEGESLKVSDRASLSPEGESLKVLDRASLSPDGESLKPFILPLILPREVVTTKDKVEWYCKYKKGEV